MRSPILSNSRKTLAGGENAVGASEMLQLRREFAGEEMRELIQMFSHEGSLLLERMEAAAEQRDIEALRRAAHGLRGAAANFGARALDAFCQEIEMNARDGNLVNAACLLMQVREEYCRVEMALQNECCPT